ncbi:PAS domain-containing protein, partial [Xanthovirga aplysinae]|uniref:PAS domain-containing protein n=1 Tax=Xanthovirga aplysinae TaxID=2529853 RepID=UPI0012BC41B6
MINFEHLYEEFTDAILILKNNTISFCNVAAIEFFEAKDKNELLNISVKNLAPLLQPDEKSSTQKWSRIKQEVVKGKNLRFEYFCQTLKRKKFWAEITFTPLKEEGTTIHYATCWRDINHLKNLEHNFQDFVESSPDVTSRIDKDGKF